LIGHRSTVDELPIGRALTLFFIIAIGPAPVIAETGGKSVPAGSFLPLWAMAYLWLGAGLALGQQAKTYLRRVGRSGYIFAGCSIMVVVCLDGLSIDAPIEWIKSREFHLAVPLLAWYGVFLCMAVLLMLIMLGLGTTRRAVRAHTRRLLKIFTVVGILEAALTYFVGYAGARLVWWVPHVEPPLVYEAWPLLIIALGGALTLSDPILAAAGWDAGDPGFDDEIGLWIAQQQAGVNDDIEDREGEKGKDDGQTDSPHPLVRYTMPTGWKRIRRLPGAEADRVMSVRIPFVRPNRPGMDSNRMNANTSAPAAAAILSGSLPLATHSYSRGRHQVQMYIDAISKQSTHSSMRARSSRLT
jgi:hypothetical protein